MKRDQPIKSIILLLALIVATTAFGGNGHKKKPGKQIGWYVRLITTSSDLNDTHTVFGYLKGASDAKDRYDSEALASGGGHYLYTTISHPEFEGSKEYRSDYRAFAKRGRKSDTWTIVVHSGDTNADVTIGWDGVTWVRKKRGESDFIEKHRRGRRLFANMRLVDEANGIVIDVKAQNSYTFAMDGKREHTLKWVALKEGEEEPVLAEVEAAVAKMEMVEMLSERREMMDEEAESLDGFLPPVVGK